MSIILILANVGGGKTISMVRKALIDAPHIPTFTNIRFNRKMLLEYGINADNIHPLTAENIVKKEVLSRVENNKGVVKEKYGYSFNIDFWASQKRPLNIFIDEAGILVKARKSMSHLNTCFQDFLAMSRKISSDANSSGNLILTAQTLGLIDSTCQIMAHQIRYCICKFFIYCEKCRWASKTDSEAPEPINECPNCGNRDLKRANFTIEERRFKGGYGATALHNFETWRITLDDSIPYRKIIIPHAEKYFPLYDTFQLKDMFTGYTTPKDAVFMKEKKKKN